MLKTILMTNGNYDYQCPCKYAYTLHSGCGDKPFRLTDGQTRTPH